MAYERWTNEDLAAEIRMAMEKVNELEEELQKAEMWAEELRLAARKRWAREIEKGREQQFPDHRVSDSGVFWK